MPIQRWREAWRVAERKRAGTSRALATASLRRNAAASAPNRPPTSMPTTTSLQRRATASSGYVSRRLRLAAAATALPAVRSAPGRGAPSCVNGDTKVVSTHNGKPLAMTSRRRSSWRSTTTLRSRRRTLVATVAPASRQTLAAARSGGMPRERQQSNTWASSAVVAVLIKPGAAAAPGRVEGKWQPQSPDEQDPEGGGLEAELGGGGGRGEHTGSRWAAAVSSTARDAKRCQPLVRSTGSSSAPGFWEGRAARRFAHGGTWKPCSARKTAHPCKAARLRALLAPPGSSRSQDSEGPRGRHDAARKGLEDTQRHSHPY